MKWDNIIKTILKHPLLSIIITIMFVGAIYDAETNRISLENIIIIAIIVLIVIWLIKKRKIQISTKYNNSQTPASNIYKETIYTDIDEEIKFDLEYEYSGKYQKKYLLSKNEYSEYKKLKEYAYKRNLQICPKVRLLDLLEPRRGENQYKKLFYKIQAKHVDFVICDQNLYVKAILELDDNSHNQPDRKERDEFVDTILRDVGYTVIRTRYITETTLDVIN